MLPGKRAVQQSFILDMVLEVDYSLLLESTDRSGGWPSLFCMNFKKLHKSARPSEQLASGKISEMGLEKQLTEKKDAIVKDWFERVSRTYAPDTAQFLNSVHDAITNPIGHSLRSGLAGLFEQLLVGPDKDTVKTYLDPIVRIRAVQDFTPSQATAFVFILKTVIRDHLKKELSDNRTLQSLYAFESKIDSLSLYAFDIYMECREKLYDLKSNVERSKVYKAFKRAGLIVETPEDAPDL